MWQMTRKQRKATSYWSGPKCRGKLCLIPWPPLSGSGLALLYRGALKDAKSVLLLYGGLWDPKHNQFGTLFHQSLPSLVHLENRQQRWVSCTWFPDLHCLAHGSLCLPDVSCCYEDYPAITIENRMTKKQCRNTINKSQGNMVPSGKRELTIASPRYPNTTKEQEMTLNPTL